MSIQEMEETLKTYVLRTSNHDRTSRGGFQWPESGPVECPDWSPEAKCGNGLHGALMGQGDGILFNWSTHAVWQVVAVDADQIVDLGGKVKFPRGEVIFSGDRKGATDLIASLGGEFVIGRMIVTDQPLKTTGGDYSIFTGGDGSTLTGGYGSTLAGSDFSTLAGGDFSTLTGGRYSTLTGGHHSKLTGSYGSTLTGGYGSMLTGGNGSTLTGGDGSILTWRIWDGSRLRLRTFYVGEDCEAGVAYRLEGDKLVKHS